MTPNAFMVKNWYKKTPDNFRFTAKFPTGQNRLVIELSHLNYI